MNQYIERIFKNNKVTVKPMITTTAGTILINLIWQATQARFNPLFVGPTGVYLLDFFCSAIQFYLLLSTYLCFISFLYLDLYVLGDVVLLSKAYFMQSNYLCVLIHICIKGALKPVSALQLNILLTLPRRYFFSGSFMFFLSVLCYVFVCVCLFSALWPPAGKGLTSWLSFVVSHCEFVTFPLVSWVRCGT